MAFDPQRRGGGGFSLGRRRLSTETKHSTKSTELWFYLAVVAGILIAAALIGADDDAGQDAGDYFRADQAWALISWLTIGYMIARGLAKSGSREPYWEGGSNAERGDDDDDDARTRGGGGSTVAR